MDLSVLLPFILEVIPVILLKSALAEIRKLMKDIPQYMTNESVMRLHAIMLALVVLSRIIFDLNEIFVPLWKTIFE